MCDYSLMHNKSRPAAVEDKLTVVDFGTGTHGFAPSEDISSRWAKRLSLRSASLTAVCVLPGTEIAFDAPIKHTKPSRYADDGWAVAEDKTSEHSVARFCQINKGQPRMHHDALELPNGEQA